MFHYFYQDLHGIERVVEYVADEHGYRAEIKTNEPGTDNQNPADVLLHANPIVVDEPRHGYGAPSYAAPSYAAPSHAAPRHPSYPRY